MSLGFLRINGALLRIDQITMVYPHLDGLTRIVMANGRSYDVYETVDQVGELILSAEMGL